MIAKANNNNININDTNIITVWILNFPTDEHSKYQGHLINYNLKLSC